MSIFDRTQPRGSNTRQNHAVISRSQDCCGWKHFRQCTCVVDDALFLCAQGVGSEINRHPEPGDTIRTGVLSFQVDPKGLSGNRHTCPVISGRNPKWSYARVWKTQVSSFHSIPNTGTEEGRPCHASSEIRWVLPLLLTMESDVCPPYRNVVKHIYWIHVHARLQAESDGIGGCRWTG